MTEGGSSSESSESDSSEEAAAHVEPSQDPQQAESTVTDIPNTEAQQTADVLPTANVEPSLATADTSVQPEPDVGQIPTDPLQLLPEDPSQSAPGTDTAQETPQESVHTDATEVQLNNEGTLQPETDTTIGTGGDNTQPQGSSTTTTTDTFQETTPPSLPDNKATLNPFSSSSTLPIPINAAMTGVPVCFTFQFKTQEPNLPRGDSM